MKKVFDEDEREKLVPEIGAPMGPIEQNLDMLFPDYDDIRDIAPMRQNYRNPERELRKKKAVRERNLMSTLEDSLVKELFEGKDLDYEMIHSSKSTVVSVRIRGRRWAEFRFKPTIDSEQRIQELQKIPEHVAALKALWETMDGNVTVVKKPD